MRNTPFSSFQAQSSGGAWNQPPQHEEHTWECRSLQQAEQLGLKLRVSLLPRVGPAEAGSAALLRWLREAAR